MNPRVFLMRTEGSQGFDRPGGCPGGARKNHGTFPGKHGGDWAISAGSLENRGEDYDDYDVDSFYRRDAD